MNSVKLNKDLKEKIQSCLKVSGIKQKELADMLGYDEHSLSMIMNGKRNLPIEMADKIAEILGVRKEYIIGYDEYKTDVDRSAALKEKYWKTHIEDPVHIMSIIKDMLTVENFQFIENELTNDEINIVYVEYEDDETPADISSRVGEKLKRPKVLHRVGIKHKDGRTIYISDSKYHSILQDIYDYAVFKLEREFKDADNYYSEEDKRKVPGH